jgi:hypothetical protein
VTGPPAFKAAPVVGTGTAYARNDHAHGLPASVALTQTNSGNPDPTPIWSVQPDDAAKGLFQGAVGGSLNGTLWDYVLYLGYNAAPATFKPGEPIMSWENHVSYLSGTAREVNSFFRWTDAAGHTTHPFSFSTAVDGSAWPNVGPVLSGDLIAFYDATGVYEVAAFIGAPNNGNRWRIDGDQGGSPKQTTFELDGGGQADVQIQLAAWGNTAYLTAKGHTGAFTINGPAAAWFVVYNQVICGLPNLATTATAGFMCMPNMSGAPTGVPPQEDPLGFGWNPVPMCFDRTNHKLWAYDGAWRSVTFA